MATQGSVVERCEVSKFNAAPEAHGIADDAVYAELLVRFGKSKFDLHGLSMLKLSRNIDRHALFGEIVALALKHAFSLLHDSEQLDPKINPEPWRTAYARRGCGDAS